MDYSYDFDDASTVSADTVREVPMAGQVDRNQAHTQPENFRDRFRDFFHRSRSVSPVRQAAAATGDCGQLGGRQMKTMYKNEYYTAKVPVVKTIRVPEEVQVIRKKWISQQVPTTRTKWVKQVVPVEKTIKRTIRVPCTTTKMRNKTVTSWKTVTKSRKVPYTVCETPCPQVNNAAQTCRPC